MITTPLLEGLVGRAEDVEIARATSSGSPSRRPSSSASSCRSPTALIPTYLQYATAWPQAQIDATVAELARRVAHARATPSACWPGRSATSTTAPGAGEQAQADFDRVFRDHEAPREIPEFPLEPSAGRAPTASCELSRLLTLAGLAELNREAGRGASPRARSRSTAPL